MLGRKFKEIIGIKVAYGTFFRGRNNVAFPNTIDLKKYSAKKKKHMDTYISELESERTIGMDYVPITKVATALGSSQQTIVNRIKRKQINGKKIQGAWYAHKNELKKALKDTRDGI